MSPLPHERARPSPGPLLAQVVARLRAAGCVFAEDEAALLVAEAGAGPGAAPGAAPSAAMVLEGLVVRRVAGEPLEQVLGWVDFCGLRIGVCPGVFVPRQRTALLVEVAVRQARPGAVVVDLGCGTGAVLRAVQARVPGLEGYAADVDPAAVACARRGLPAARVLQGDLYDALPPGLRGRVDLLLANAPYVPTGQLERLPREARDHEHRVALDGGPDGLDVQRRVVADAGRWLAPGGWLLIETGEPQHATSVGLLVAAGLSPRTWRAEETGGLVVGGRVSRSVAPTSGPGCGAGAAGRPT